MINLLTKPLMILLPVSLSFISCERSVPEKASEAEGRDLILTTSEQRKAVKDNQFTFELFSAATGGLRANQNALLSPLSVGMALAMTNNGAAGETRAVIEQVIKTDSIDTGVINDYYRKLMTDLPALDPKTTLDIANSIWYKQEFEVLPSFLDINREFYQARVAALDFSDPAAPDVINDWVSASTREKIPAIIDNIPSQMVMYLINAVCFKGEWEQRFDRSATSEGTFSGLNGSRLQTDFMHVTHTFNVAVTDEVEAVELPYGNKKYSMVVLKPKETLSSAQLVYNLATADTWRTITEALRPRKTGLSLPKFKFSYENQLNAELSGMGMGEAFSHLADFSGISSGGGLRISEVKHTSFIEVNEEGTEAAAATSVGIGVTSAPSLYTLRIDRPFLFVIREMHTGLILFIGQVNNPRVTTTMQ